MLIASIIAICFLSLVSAKEMNAEEYIRVIRKMEEYCSHPYRQDDEKKIHMYSECFCHFNQSCELFVKLTNCLLTSSYQDLDLVKKCRMMTFRSNDQLKKADCSKEMTPESEEIRSCIMSEMKKKDPKFVFDQEDDDSSSDAEISTKDFFDCMDKVF